MNQPDFRDIDPKSAGLPSASAPFCFIQATALSSMESEVAPVTATAHSSRNMAQTAEEVEQVISALSPGEQHPLQKAMIIPHSTYGIPYHDAELP